MRSKKVTFNNLSGEDLTGSIDLPLTGSADSFALFAHCFTCSSTLKAVDNISRALTMKGIGVLRFDFTGLGQSKGEFKETNFSTNLQDLRCAYDFLRDNYEPPQLLIGHSLGGAAALHAASMLPLVRAVSTIGAPASPGHVRHLIEDEEEIKLKGQAKVNIGGRPFLIKEQFLKDLEKNDTKKSISSLGKALLILHSPQDSIVSIENAAEIYECAKHPKSFITMDGADHLLGDEKDSLYVGQVIATWASRYISSREEEKNGHQIGRAHV